LAGKTMLTANGLAAAFLAYRANAGWFDATFSLV
jgi:hypothetical protein